MSVVQARIGYCNAALNGWTDQEIACQSFRRESATATTPSFDEPLHFEVSVVQARIGYCNTGGVALFYANRPKQIGPDLETFVELMEGVNERYLAIGITDVPYTNFYVSPSYMMHYIHEMPTYIESLASYYLYYTNGQWRPIAFEGRNKLFELAGIGPGGGTSGWNYVFTPDAGNKWMEIEDMWWLSRYWGKHLGSVPWTGFLWECYRALSVMTATSATIYYDQSDIIYGDRYVYFRDDRPMPMAYHEEEGGQPPPWWTNLNLLADFSNMLVITVPPLPDSAWPAVQTNTFWGERFMFEGVVMAHTDYDWNGLQTQYWAIAYGTNWLWDCLLYTSPSPRDS